MLRLREKGLTLRERRTFQSRKGFFVLYDVTAWLVIGLVLLIVVTFSVYQLNREREQVRKAQEVLTVKSFMDKSLYYVPQTKTVSSTDTSVTLNLFNGCTLTINYNPDTKEISYSKSCPQGESIAVPGGAKKVDSFTVRSTSEGTEVVVCRDNSCYSYFYRKIAG